MIPFRYEAEALPFTNGDYVYIPEIRKAITEKAATVEAYAVSADKVTPFELIIDELTDDERKIILAGCLINFYRN